MTSSSQNRQHHPMQWRRWLKTPTSKILTTTWASYTGTSVCIWMRRIGGKNSQSWARHLGANTSARTTKTLCSGTANMQMVQSWILMMSRRSGVNWRRSGEGCARGSDHLGHHGWPYHQLINLSFTSRSGPSSQFSGLVKIPTRPTWSHSQTTCTGMTNNTPTTLDMANWRIVLNAVCLPVLSYGLQLWFIPGGSNRLINMLQVVHNKMVCMVVGAFCTAPCKALCHLMRMLPMKLYAEKLTYTSAFRLYRLPRASQLLRRLSPNWHAPGHGDLPLVVHKIAPSVVGENSALLS